MTKRATNLLRRNVSNGSYSHLLSVNASKRERVAGPKVNVETTLGEFTIELNQEQAPISSWELSKIRSRWQLRRYYLPPCYSRFMAQGGGFNQDMQQQATYALSRMAVAVMVWRTTQQPSRWLVPTRQTLQLVSSTLTTQTTTSWTQKTATRVTRYLKSPTVLTLFKRWQPYQLSEWAVCRYPCRSNRHHESDLLK